VARHFQVTFDAADPGPLSRFWAEVLGYQLEPPPDGFASWEEALAAFDVPEDRWDSASAIVDPDGVGPRFYFQRVPEGKAAKNRVHLDVSASPGPEASAEERRPPIEAEAARLEGLGATRVGVVEEMGGIWMVMLDPEGNEFCVT